MPATPLETAVLRLERAILRLERAPLPMAAAVSRPVREESGDALAQLQARHERLRARVAETVGALDGLIARAGSAD